MEFATSPSAEQAIKHEEKEKRKCGTKNKKQRQLVKRDVTGQVQQNFSHWGRH